MNCIWPLAKKVWSRLSRVLAESVETRVWLFALTAETGVCDCPLRRSEQKSMCCRLSVRRWTRLESDCVESSACGAGLLLQLVPWMGCAVGRPLGRRSMWWGWRLRRRGVCGGSTAFLVLFSYVLFYNDFLLRINV